MIFYFRRIFYIFVIFAGFFLFSACSGSKQLSLKEQYESYKHHYITRDGRIIDPSRNNVTTSEGQAYMLLRSVLMNDKKTFDLVLKWSNNNLRRRDALYSWLWGENNYGKYTVLDYNNASDAEMDISFALILAYEKWKSPYYLDLARQILYRLWDTQIINVNGKKLLAPGIVQAQNHDMEFNPSYFSPYYMKKFQIYDSHHNWRSVGDDMYYYLTEVMNATATGLPPNFFSIKDGKVFISSDKKGDFSYDAIRVFNRILLDYKMTKDKRALQVLKKSKFFIDKWEKGKPLYINYQANGELRDKDKFVGAAAMIYPAIKLYDEHTAEEIYEQEIKSYLENPYYWASNNDYYGKNLLWFGEYVDEIK
ncbi:MAG: glycosyl hydrolase family 8 [Candidatus Gastranaerophilales bacterium]|nr:glycosyl hydrolase family 8 [Candidatus Gastranaerophilales bacterium]